jgi:glycosyltransferase involved in cell wall biosynthesis
MIAASDCVVSLHRAEGYGLTLAEAMYLGKPVIATAYSGNLDFTLPGNSFLVGYKMCPVGKGNDPYDPHAQWADPLLDEAAAHMQTAAANAELRTRVARAGQEFVREHVSHQAVGARMRQRLEHLLKTRVVAAVS